jgi:DNA-binding response OmpR family regulator
MCRISRELTPGRARTTIRRVLVVDDDQGVRQVIARALGAERIAVDQAGDGHEGLCRALLRHYEVVILDLQLPRLDGMSVLRRLRSARPGQPVIMSSCKSDASTRRDCIQAGAHAFLAKPFALTDLLAFVAESIAATEPRRSPREADLAPRAP